MIVEILFPDVAALYGDSGNIMFLHQALPEAEIIHTSLADRPAFVDRAVNMIYGPDERKLAATRTELMRPFCAAIQEHIEADRGCF